MQHLGVSNYMCMHDHEEEYKSMTAAGMDIISDLACACKQLHYNYV